ncbi:MAG: MBL fold metallo-hydrolase [Dehalococcoidia bacterium]|nr:MBL fold metallo-hydrolase [Dehalococcoidia bacterium]
MRLVETGDLNILLDTGASTSVPHNAQIFGLDLSTIDKIVLSHGHYDHSGELKGVLE